MKKGFITSGPGGDKAVRAVRVRTKGGITIRPIKKLYSM